MSLLQLVETLVKERQYGVIILLYGTGIGAGYLFAQALELANRCYHSRKSRMR